MRAFIDPILLIVRHRRMLWATTQTDVRTRFAGSVLGLAWLAAYPLLVLGAYAAVYVAIFRVRFDGYDSIDYVLLIFCGLIPFLGFAEGLSASVTAVTNNRNLVRNTLFPVELLGVKAVLASQCSQIVGTAVLLTALAAAGRLGPTAALVLPVWVCQVGFGIGVGWIVGTLNVFLRDLQMVVGVVVMVLMMASPIAYTPEMVPGALRPVLVLNPLAHFIRAYQECLMLGTVPGPGTWAAVAGLGLGAPAVGYWFLRRLKPVFADSL
jgi:lipopolysaccharide transport system permease protein